MQQKLFRLQFKLIRAALPSHNFTLDLNLT